MKRISYTNNQKSILELCPNIKGKSLLYVGFNSITPSTGINSKGWFYQMFVDLEFTEFCILEIYKNNVEFADMYFKGRKYPVLVEHGDVLVCDKIFRKKCFDVSMWWHGPEHLEKNRIPIALEALEKITKKLVILGFPNGYLEQDEVYGNPYEMHVSDPDEKYIQQFGYKSKVIEWNNMQHVTAVKELT